METRVSHRGEGPLDMRAPVCGIPLPDFEGQFRVRDVWECSPAQGAFSEALEAEIPGYLGCKYDSGNGCSWSVWSFGCTLPVYPRGMLRTRVMSSERDRALPRSPFPPTATECEFGPPRESLLDGSGINGLSGVTPGFLPYLTCVQMGTGVWGSKIIWRG